MNAATDQIAPSSVQPKSSLVLLHDFGQDVWLDFLARRFVGDGSLKKLVDQDGLTGVTSNPSIFEKAIGGSSDYDSALRALEGNDDFGVMALYERLAIEDIRQAADILRPAFERTHAADGYVSLEVSPYLAMETAATVAEGRRLWESVGRKNLMIKVPATAAGLPAIRELIGGGINVNVTLLFSRKVYEQVVEAYLSGLEQLVAQGGDPSKIASVASFFVSRIDVAIDALIEGRLAQESNALRRAVLSGLRGKVAIANAKLAYRHYKQAFSGPRWEKLQAKGARTQRLLWASTGTKNKTYSDVLYVEELIAPDTVNTMPPATMDAFRDHGRPRASLEQNVDEAERVLADLDQSGISIDAVTDALVEDGVRLFSDAFDQLLGAVAKKRAAILGERMNAQSYKLSPDRTAAVAASLESWRRSENGRRLWAGDAALWTDADEAKWLGWLDIVATQSKRRDAFARISEDVRREKFSHAVLLGMGGSSLGPEVLAETFGHQAGYPAFIVLDSTDPAQILDVERRIDLARTLFIVSSKSGSTVEPNILKQYFFEKVKSAVGAENCGSRFIAVTDPGSSLQTQAKRDAFRSIAFGKPNIGGRYSVLSDFGMVPAAIMGLDTAKFLAATQIMVDACGADVPPVDNPGVVLGTILGLMGKSGRDKITIIASPGIADFGAWLEQLLAESTGKNGRGLIPVDAEPLGNPNVYGDDRLFVYLRLESEPDPQQDKSFAALESAGNPSVRIAISDRYNVGQEFFRWEIATAVAGSILDINPFDQPDVEVSKIKTRELTLAYERSGALPPDTSFFHEKDITLFSDDANIKSLGAADSLVSYLKAHLNRCRPGDYCAVLAYIDRNVRNRALLQEIRVMIRDRKRVATCLGFGPRFLHSTGQAYKGGPNTGVFLQITADDQQDVQVPAQRYTFGVVKAAEARGDFDVLAQRERRVLRVHLGADVVAGLEILKAVIRESLG